MVLWLGNFVPNRFQTFLFLILLLRQPKNEIILKFHNSYVIVSGKYKNRYHLTILQANVLLALTLRTESMNLIDVKAGISYLRFDFDLEIINFDL